MTTTATKKKLTLQTPETLQQVAAELHKRAADLERIAREMTEKGVERLEVGHYARVSDGVDAAYRFVLDLEARMAYANRPRMPEPAVVGARSASGGGGGGGVSGSRRRSATAKSRAGKKGR